ncbi:Uncharacterised protein [Vibrio cholerae]|nr:Uncharacterised protein [Vibrio cholerae]
MPVLTYSFLPTEFPIFYADYLQKGPSLKHLSRS